MQINKRVFWLWFLCLGLSFSLSAEDEYVISNTLISRLITIPDQHGAISVSMNCLKQNKEINHPASSWFAFSVNHQVLKASDPIWIFENVSTREMGNQGMEHVLNYRCVKEGFEGLQVQIYQQIFPHSTLIRERIQLSALEGYAYRLTKEDKELFFHFPVYELAIQTISTKEIRMVSWGNEQIALDKNKTYDDRTFDNGLQFNLAHCWMFHPDALVHAVSNDEVCLKGPLGIVRSANESVWLTAYEHASQDTRKGMDPVKMTLQRDGFAVDAQQGVEGVFNYTKTDEDLHFIGIQVSKTDNTTKVGHAILRGGYLEGEVINSQSPYQSVWSASAYIQNDDPLAVVKTYLQDQICEYPASRHSGFYYNTWGMQREYGARGKDMRGVLTEERILQEIEYATQMEIELFILDDGWQEMMGVWKPQKERLPNDLSPIKEALDKHDMKMGVWLNPTLMSKDALLFKKHPEWIILDSEGNPIKAQWYNPAIDIGGPYYDTILNDMKWLVDQGVRFFKWDAINEYNNYLPGLHHGDESHSIEERIARHEYLLPVYIARLMEELVTYDPWCSSQSRPHCRCSQPCLQDNKRFFVLRF